MPDILKLNILNSYSYKTAGLKAGPAHQNTYAIYGERAVINLQFIQVLTGGRQPCSSINTSRNLISCKHYAFWHQQRCPIWFMSLFSLFFTVSKQIRLSSFYSEVIWKPTLVILAKIWNLTCLLVSQWDGRKGVRSQVPFLKILWHEAHRCPPLI